MSISSQISDWFHLVLVGIWSDSFRWNQQESLELSGIQLEKFLLIWQVLYFQISDRNLTSSNWFQLEPVGHSKDLGPGPMEETSGKALMVQGIPRATQVALKTPKTLASGSESLSDTWMSLRDTWAPFICFKRKVKSS